MRKLYLIAVLLTTSLCSYSQFINLPDSNFRNALYSSFPLIFNGLKQLDTVAAGRAWGLSYTTGSILVGKNIKDVTGIEYLPSGTIDLSNNPIIIFNKLSSKCSHLTMRYCGLTNLPISVIQPNKLISLTFSNNIDIYFNNPVVAKNSITNFNSLPSNVKTLNIDDNNIINPPQIPLSVTTLSIARNQLTNLPNLSDSMVSLDCSSNRITVLPTLPKTLNILMCAYNLLTSIPDIPRPTMPSTEKWIDFYSNNISVLPKIPISDSVTYYYFGVGKNPINDLKSLSGMKVKYFECSQMVISSIPDTLEITGSFLCISSRLPKLPIIKNSYDLDEVNLALTKVDTLRINSFPNRISNYDISYSNVSEIPASFDRIFLAGRPDIQCLKNIFPNRLYDIFADSSIIKCTPSNFKNATNWSIHQNYMYVDNYIFNTYGMDSLKYFNWLTNRYPVYDTTFKIKHSKLHFCAPTNNPNSCSGFPNIIGSVFVDSNNNLLKDSTELFKANVPVRLKANNRTVTNANGVFSIMADSIGSQIVTIMAPRFYTAVPSTINLSFGKYDTLVNVPPIALQRTIIKDSLSTKITPINWAARPGFVYPYLVQYKNVGSTAINATASLLYNSALLNYDSSSNSAVANTGSQLNLALNSFAPGQERSYIAYFKVKPSGSLLGQILKAYSNIAGGAATATDSTAIIIGGSYDPNDKLSTPQLSTTQVAEGQFINYTIRFQNTGTDTAFTVVIADTLNSLLQANTFEFLGSSHACKTTIQDNKLYFEFRNILLPDSNVNLIASNGFVNFRIKPVSSVVLNTVIPNKGAIYFDYNEPIITNTATTTIRNTILPTHLLGFSAALHSSKTVLLYWNTTNELNTQFFVVEQSTNGKDFTALETITAKGTGNNSYYTNKVYNSLPAELYYLLKTIDKDGALSYSNIIKIKQASANGWSIVNNPAKGKLLIEVKEKSLQNTQARLVNAQGQVVQTISLQIGFNNLNVSSLNKGLYYVQTNQGTKQVVVD